MKTSGHNAGKISTVKRIGLFGGTFNPVHSGHLLAAQVVMSRLSMTDIWFIPAAIPPHKTPEGVVAAEHRLEMLRLAAKGVAGLSVSEVELNRTGPSYTIDTVRYFLSHAATDTQYHLIVGLDAFFEIDTWKSYQKLMRLVPMVVLVRPDFQPENRNPARERVLGYLQTRISPSYVFSKENQQFECPGRPPLVLIDGGLMAISATVVRERIRARVDIAPFVPARVAKYIKRKGLYR